MILLFVSCKKVYATGLEEPMVRDAESLVIALDPGHGGDEDGAVYYGFREQDLNYTIAIQLKEELERYENVTVVLTRDAIENVSLIERANRAKERGADILISLHLNASSAHTSHGASVYISTGEKNKDALRQLADCFLGEFEGLGLTNAGTFARVTQLGGRREDGSFEDYYGILRHAYNAEIPALIVEHCYMDAKEDKTFFESREGLEQLAAADARAIAGYYGLMDKNGKRAVALHATRFGATTKANELQYYDAPEIRGVRLVTDDRRTPEIAVYEVDIKDGIGISSIYLVYQNDETGETTTVFLLQSNPLTTGTYTLNAYIPHGLELGHYTLRYIGANNVAGYDAGYNYCENEMIGYGKCDWLSSFSYFGEADLNIEDKGNLAAAQQEKLLYELIFELRNKMDFRIPVLSPERVRLK